MFKNNFILNGLFILRDLSTGMQRKTSFHIDTKRQAEYQYFVFDIFMQGVDNHGIDTFQVRKEGQYRSGVSVTLQYSSE